MSRYDFQEIMRRRHNGASWAELAQEYGVATPTIRGAFSRWQQREAAQDVAAPSDQNVGARQEPFSDSGESQRLLTASEVARITSIEDLIDFFEIDTERWEVQGFKVSKWEQRTGEGIEPMYSVKANLRRVAPVEGAAAEAYRLAAEELRAAPPRGMDPSAEPKTAAYPTDSVLLEIAVFDPHIGMYAWAQEVGEDYDSGIAVQAYLDAVHNAIQLAHLYPVDRILYVVGNDLSHVDALGVQQKGGTTTAGTAQDFDSRLPKMFSAVRRAVVQGIDMAASLGVPVDVLMVPGNHDEQTTYKLGEVLAAWYRNDKGVRVFYDPESDDERYWPRRRQYYQYGHNALMFTHGTEYRRKRDPLPLIFATECPPVLWASTTHREIHTGHNHIRMTGRYQPEADVTETRAIITRSLPGLTATDSWHYNEGYRHQRAATALFYRRSGGLAGLHELTPEA